MQHVTISDDAWTRLSNKARETSAEMGSLYGSIENGGGNFAGIFGELVVAEVLDAVHDPNLQYDIEYDDETYDVKTKRRWAKPKPFYDCSVSDYNTEQDCDYYYFVSTKKSYDELWLLGYLEHDDYYEQATFREEGEVDPDNGFEFKADCWNVPISDLKTLDALDEKPDTIEL